MPYKDPQKRYQCNIESNKRWRKKHWKEYYEKNKEIFKARREKYRKQHRKKYLESAKRTNHKRYSNPEKRKKILLSHKKWQDNLYKEGIEAYGGMCACCGEKDFLTIDHVNNDGNKHRKKVGGSIMVYVDLKKRKWPKENYQLLCMNCNWGKRFTGICPHKTKNGFK